MKIAVAVPAHALELPSALRTTTASFKAQGADVYIVVDDPQTYLKFVRYVGDLRPMWLITQQAGVGAARNYGLAHLASSGYDCVLTADSHVRLLDSLDVLCRDALAYGATQGWRIDATHQQLVSGTIPSDKKPWFGRMYSVTLSKYVEVFDCVHKPWSYEPLTAYSATALKHLMKAQSGYVIIGRGFGAELSELTMSLSRLGYKVACSHVRYLHRFSKGDEPFWRDRWSDEQNRLFKESFGVYVAKHIPPEAQQRSPYYPFLKEVKTWQWPLIEEFNRSARYSTVFVYELFLNSGAPKAAGNLGDLLV
ncbi:MAG: glycosyltransferase family A protein [Thermoproteus sp.]